MARQATDTARPAPMRSELSWAEPMPARRLSGPTHIATAGGGLRAAREDDDSINPPPLPQLSAGALVPQTHASPPRADEGLTKWTREVERAGLVWRLLTEDDLSSIESHDKTLQELIQARYALSPAELDAQITGFIKDHQTSPL